MKTGDSVDIREAGGAEAVRILERVGALLSGHFLLSSGKHSDRYCQCAKLYERPEEAKAVTRIIAERLRPQLEALRPDLIVGPAMGGIIAAYELAAQLGLRNMFTERADNVMTLRRGFVIEPGERVIIMEDVVTTGKSSGESARIVRELGGLVAALACVVDRSVEELPLPVFSAARLDIRVYDAGDCPLCKLGLPLVKPGSRRF